jgi:DNA-binding MarR family transcriptional regulator
MSRAAKKLPGRRSTAGTARAVPNGKPARASRAGLSCAGLSRADLPLTTSRPELLEQGRDRQFRHLVHALFGFAAHHERIRSGHGKAIGLAGIEYTVLISIAHLAVDGDVNVKTVADHLYLSGAFITAVTQRLLKLGMIHKRIDTGDRRRVTLSVSNKGRAALERLAPVQRQVNDVEFGCLSHDEFALLTGIVDRLIDSGARAVALQSYLLAELSGRSGAR